MTMGAFFALGFAPQIPKQKTGLSAAIPQPARGGLAGFPLQSPCAPAGRAAACYAIRVLFFAAACFFASCTPEVNLPQQYAFVYGSDYNGSAVSPVLTFPDDDARALAGILRRKGYEVQEQLNSFATKSNFVNAIASLSATAEEDSMFLFYFSGHGHSAGGSQYIVFHDNFFMSDNELMRLISLIPSRQKVVIIDACYSGGFIGDSPGVDTGNSPPISSAGEAFSKYFANTASGDIAYTEAIVITAAGERELSYEMSGYNHGIFTYFLLQTPRKADVNKDGYVTASEAYYFAKNAVVNNWNPGATQLGGAPFYPHISGGAMDFVLFEAD
jgi:uncharacterized caspase-like protein